MDHDQTRRIQLQRDHVERLRRDIDRLRATGANGPSADRSREADLRDLEQRLRVAIDELTRLQRA